MTLQLVELQQMQAPVRTGGAEMGSRDEREDRREGPSDRRVAVEATEKPSAINDPRFWVSITAILLTLALALLTLAINKLGSIDSTVQSIRDSTTRNVADIETLRRDLARAEADNAALRQKVEKDREDQTAYNFTLAKDLKEIQVLLRLKNKTDS